MIPDPLILLSAFMIGSFGSLVSIFLSFFQFNQAQITFPNNFHSKKNYVLYVLIGGGAAAIFQISSEALLPLYALGVGSVWPVLLSNLTGVKNIKSSARNIVKRPNVNITKLKMEQYLEGDVCDLRINPNISYSGVVHYFQIGHISNCLKLRFSIFDGEGYFCHLCKEHNCKYHFKMIFEDFDVLKIIKARGIKINKTIIRIQISWKSIREIKINKTIRHKLTSWKKNK